MGLNNVIRDNMLHKAITPAAVSLLRVDKSLSEVNHKLFRQARDYKVRVRLDSLAIAAGGNNTGYLVYTLSQHWALRQAYEAMRKVYVETVKEAAAGMGRPPKMGKWFDYRVGWSTDVTPEFMRVHPTHWVDGTGDYTEYVDGKMASAVHDDVATSETPEYAYATITDDSGNVYELAMLGDSDEAATFDYSAMYEWDRSRQGPAADLYNSDSDSDDLPFAALRTEEDVELAETLNDYEEAGLVPPYDRFRVPGYLQYQGAISSDSGTFLSAERSTPWFYAPLGFVLIRPANTSATTPSAVILDVAGGMEKGVTADAPFGGL